MFFALPELHPSRAPQPPLEKGRRNSLENKQKSLDLKGFCASPFSRGGWGARLGWGFLAKEKIP
jgi:hypothetical protein